MRDEGKMGGEGGKDGWGGREGRMGGEGGKDGWGGCDTLMALSLLRSLRRQFLTRHISCVTVLCNKQLIEDSIRRLVNQVIS